MSFYNNTSNGNCTGGAISNYIQPYSDPSFNSCTPNQGTTNKSMDLCYRFPTMFSGQFIATSSTQYISFPFIVEALNYQTNTFIQSFLFTSWGSYGSNQLTYVSMAYTLNPYSAYTTSGKTYYYSTSVTTNPNVFGAGAGPWFQPYPGINASPPTPTITVYPTGITNGNGSVTMYLETNNGATFPGNPTIYWSILILN